MEVYFTMMTYCKKFYKGFVLFLGTIISAVGQENYPALNTLGTQTSPYLLQHAKNPVGWKPWNALVFKKAQTLDKLVIISVGYASCHWCHVMEEESFEDPEVASVMNTYYLSIKVDREERPDIDQTYMTALRLIGKDGGWPLNVIALPNGDPIYAGTYHSKTQWMALLNQMQELYKTRPDQLRAFAADLKKGIAAENTLITLDKQGLIDPNLLSKGVANWQKNWDLVWGGNLGQEKFMRPNGLMFLIDYALLSGDERIKDHIENTLDNMASGGIYDQLAGGFFRYSTDPEWRVPHFEKMLYDNAQMVQLYAKAFKVFKKERYKEVATATIRFLNQEMKGAFGGYMAAIDADLHGEEGALYRWTPEELKEILAKDWPLFAAYYRLDPYHLWEGKYYLLQAVPDKTLFFKKTGLTPDSLAVLTQQWRAKLLKAKRKRGTPLKDTKVITSWNALLVSAYVTAYESFKDPAYLQAAQVLFKALTPNTEKPLTHVLGKLAPSPVFSEDYAFLAQASLSLYFATANQAYLIKAQELMQALNERFYMAGERMYQYNVAKGVLSPVLKITDGVLPSDNAVAAAVNFLLGHIGFNPKHSKRSLEAVAQMGSRVSTNLNTYTQWGANLLPQVFSYYEMAIVGPKAVSMAQEVLAYGIPNVLVVASEKQSELPLFVDRYEAGETYIYVCKNYACKLPVTTVKEALLQLE